MGREGSWLQTGQALHGFGLFQARPGRAPSCFHGSPAEVRSINKVGMERSGFSGDEVETARGVFKVLYKSDLNRSQAIERLENEFSAASPDIVGEIIEFARSSERGLA